MSDTLERLGKLIVGDAGRDAVHIAVAPVIAAHRMQRGCHIGLLKDNTASMAAETLVGIVDPFLSVEINKGDRFWLYLYPQTITSLRHEWRHPAFDGVEPTQPRPIVSAASEAWLKAYAESHDVPSYDVMMKDVDYHVNNKIYVPWVTIHGYSSYDQIPPEFWTHYENVSRATSFSCSC